MCPTFESMPKKEEGAVTPHGAPMRRARLHRLAEVRREQGVSLRCMAKSLNTCVREVRRMERPTTDLNLSTLLEWHKVLNVPLADLFVEPGTPLSEPVLKRARMVKLMKTAMAIHETTDQAPIRRLSRTLIDQLVELMPELAGVSSWHTVGQRRTLNEFGQALERCMPERMFFGT